jgi:hypothetical protein
MDHPRTSSSRRAWRHAAGVPVAVLCLAAGMRDARAKDAARSVPRVVKVAGKPSETGADKPLESPDEPERDPVLVRPFLQIIYAAFDFDTSDDDISLEIVPNPTTNLGVTLGAWGLSLSLSMDVGRVEPIDEYGDSDNFNLEFTYPFRVFGNRELDVTAFLHYHTTLSMNREGLSRQVVDDAVISTLGVDAAFVFDPKFSIADAFSDFMPRSGSKGSWFMRSSIEFWFLGFLSDPERRLIPAELSGGFGDFVDVSGWNQASATLGGGYAYDWNITHRFFLSMMGNLGLAGTLFDLSFASGGTESSRALGFSAGLQLAASFVTKEFHAGLVSGAVADSVTTHRVDVVSQRVSSTLFAGMRF